MARFFFRLERVLSVRRHEEERDRILFATAVQRHEKANSTLREISQRLDHALTESRDALKNVTRVDALASAYDFRASLLKQKSEAEEWVEKTGTELESARKVLVQAQQKRRVLEQLRERKWETWRKEEESREQDQLDEIALQSHGRKDQEIQS